jgi:uncharacterized protein
MMTLWGADFKAARVGWRYAAQGAPVAWVAVLCAAALMLLLGILQGITGYAAYATLFSATSDQIQFQSDFAKATLVGLLPAGILTCLVSWRLARRTGTSPTYGMPLHVPSLGALGWATVVAAFCITVVVIYFSLFAILGIDPATYMPTAEGVNDPNSSAGLVEKALADLADEPLLFALAIPGLAVAVPVAEELIFRGPLFAALTTTRLGWSGTVVVTAGLWALMHAMAAPWIFCAIIFFMGVILGIILLRFGSIIVTIVCHCAWNSYSTLAIIGGLAG